MTQTPGKGARPGVCIPVDEVRIGPSGCLGPKMLEDLEIAGEGRPGSGSGRNDRSSTGSTPDANGLTLRISEAGAHGKDVLEFHTVFCRTSNDGDG
jgi:hypothetical protein